MQISPNGVTLLVSGIGVAIEVGEKEQRRGTLESWRRLGDEACVFSSVIFHGSVGGRG